MTLWKIGPDVLSDDDSPVHKLKEYGRQLTTDLPDFSATVRVDVDTDRISAVMCIKHEKSAYEHRLFELSFVDVNLTYPVILYYHIKSDTPVRFLCGSLQEFDDKLVECITDSETADLLGKLQMLSTMK